MVMGPCILVYNDHINNQRAFYALYLMVMLYMFRASLAHHQEFKETVFSARCHIQLFLDSVFCLSRAVSARFYGSWNGVRWLSS